MRVVRCCNVKVLGLRCRAGEALGPFSFLFARLLFLGGVQDSTGRTATIQNTFASYDEGMQRVGLTDHKSLKNIAHY